MTLAGPLVTEKEDTKGSSRATRVPTVGFRPDIDGLRAVAIVLVVAYHADVRGFASGFIGVDIFFVISGFLIMTQLDKEFTSSGTLRLPTFWARRARRLVPVAVLVTLFVIIVSQLVYSAFHWQRVAIEALATTFYVSNEVYRNTSTDYFAPALTSSPLLNTWSLAVEEQFYLVWPVLLVLVTRIAPGKFVHRARMRAVGIVTALSFFLSFIVLATDPSSAYFSGITRAWEFGVGAMLALSVARFKVWSVLSSRVLVGVAVVLLGWAMLTITDKTPYPGWAAVLPVLGTAALITAGGGRDDLLSRTLGRRPLQALGRLSYSWYLWHWPVMVLGIRGLGSDSPTTKVALVMAALVPALVTYRYVETVLRRAPALVRSNRRTAAVIMAFVLVATSASALLWIRGDVAMQDPYMQRLAAAREDSPALPGECATNDVAVLLASCTKGDLNATSTVLLIGDSHAAHWLPALDEVGKRHNLRVVASMASACPFLNVRYSSGTPACADKIRGSVGLVESLHPSLVVTSNTVGYIGAMLDQDGQLGPAAMQPAMWQAGMQERAEQLRRLGVPFLVLQDVPGNRFDPNECLAKTREIPVCQSTSAGAMGTLASMYQAELAALAAAGWGSSFDPLPYLCHDGICSFEYLGQIVYCDSHHLTNRVSRSFEKPVAVAVMRALGRPEPE